MRAPEWALIVVALITLTGTILTYRASRRRDGDVTTQQMIDQLQEEGDRRDTRIARLERQQRIQADYIGQLRQHIAHEQPPPPPPWPEGLIT